MNIMLFRARSKLQAFTFVSIRYGHLLSKRTQLCYFSEVVCEAPIKDFPSMDVLR